MSTKGQVLVDSTNADTYEFLETSADTQGARCTFKSTTNRKGLLVPDHFHVLQEESFEVVSGELTIIYEGKVRILRGRFITYRVQVSIAKSYGIKPPATKSVKVVGGPQNAFFCRGLKIQSLLP